MPIRTHIETLGEKLDTSLSRVAKSIQSSIERWTCPKNLAIMPEEEQSVSDLDSQPTGVYPIPPLRDSSLEKQLPSVQTPNFIPLESESAMQTYKRFVEKSLDSGIVDMNLLSNVRPLGQAMTQEQIEQWRISHPCVATNKPSTPIRTLLSTTWGPPTKEAIAQWHKDHPAPPPPKETGDLAFTNIHGMSARSSSYIPAISAIPFKTNNTGPK